MLLELYFPNPGTIHGLPYSLTDAESLYFIRTAHPI